MKAKSLIHTQLLTDFKALKFLNNTACLTAVERLYTELPTTAPFGQILATGNGVQVEGMDYDSRMYNFSALVYDVLGSGMTQSEIDLKVDRMSNIEDVILDYLEQIPTGLNAKITGVNIYKVEVGAGDIQYADISTGIQMILKIDFRVFILIEPK